MALAALVALPLAARQDPSLSGRVLDGDGEPVAGVTVRAAPVAGENAPFEQALPPVGVGSPVAEAITDDTGAFRLTPPAPWVYEIQLAAPDLTPQPAGVFAILEADQATPPLRLDRSNVLALDLAVPGIRRLAAEVPLAGATVVANFPAPPSDEAGTEDAAAPQLAPRFRRQVFVVHADAEGRVRLPVPPATRDPRDAGGPRLEVRAPRHHPRVLDSRVLPPLARQPGSASTPYGVSLQALPEHRTLRLQRPDGSVMGDGARARGDWVAATDEAGQAIPLLVGDDGALTAAWPVAQRPWNTPYRRARLFVSGRLQAEVTPAFVSRHLTAPLPGTVVADANADETPSAETQEAEDDGPPTLALEAAATIAGRLVDATSGEPVTDAVACLHRPWHCARTDDRGEFRLPRWGEQLTLQAPGYRTLQRPLGVWPEGEPFALLLEPEVGGAP